MAGKFSMNEKRTNIFMNEIEVKILKNINFISFVSSNVRSLAYIHMFIYLFLIDGHIYIFILKSVIYNFNWRQQNDNNYMVAMPYINRKT